MVHLIDLENVIKSTSTLLTLPDICLQLKKNIDDPDYSLTDLTKLIAKDPALTARLLKVVNSSLYSFARKISSVSQAISLIGTTQLYNLALATSAASIIRTAGGSYVELKTIWKHSIYSALLAQIIGPQSVKNRESLFVAGLLCNIGMLAVLKYSPDIAMTAIGNQVRDQFPWQREKEVLGFTMAEAGGGLLSAWSLSDEITLPVHFQHQPHSVQPHYLSCCTIHIATRLASQMITEEQDDVLDYKSTIIEDVLLVMELSDEDLVAAVTKAHEVAPEMLNVFVF